jgi:sortase (surface protein transpeptidase)
MGIPKNASEVGWFIEKPRPGQYGAAILTGHYDTPSGRPAVFYNLDKLLAGNEVIILTDWEEKFIFKVEKVISQPYKTFPKTLAYGSSTGREVRLITCGGVWNPQEKSYSNRLVVYTRLWQKE